MDFACLIISGLIITIIFGFIMFILLYFLKPTSLYLEKEILDNTTVSEKIKMMSNCNSLQREVLKRNCNFKKNEIVKFNTPGKYIVGQYYKYNIYRDLFKEGIDCNIIYCVGITDSTRFVITRRHYDSEGIFYTLRKLGNNTYKLVFIRDYDIQKADINDIGFCDEDPEVLNSLDIINERDNIGYLKD